ncbi:MAG: FAD-dependent oxidoreductase, partial [Alphaproteobacteria bacterium]
MHVVVLGAGVVGITTAYYLSEAGCKVTVIDRQPEVAAETSFANAGLISAGHVFSWASPSAPKLMLRALLGTDPGFRLRWGALPGLMGWGTRFLRQCNTDAFRANTSLKYRIASYSQICLGEIATATGIDYHRRRQGLLYYYRSDASLEQGAAKMDLMREFGHRVEIIDRAACVDKEPALAGLSTKLAGGVFCPDDESGDCRIFTDALAQICRAHGVEFRLGVTITGLACDGDQVTAVQTDQGPVTGDAYVLALGSYSPLISRTAGFKLPVYPVRGFSLSLPITDPEAGPKRGGVDEDQFSAFGRMGEVLRLTATADFTGYDASHQPHNFDAMRA